MWRDSTQKNENCKCVYSQHFLLSGHIPCYMHTLLFYKLLNDSRVELFSNIDEITIFFNVYFCYYAVCHDDDDE